MRIAAFQMQAVAGDQDRNFVRIEGAVREAAEGGADLFVAPELALPGYGAGQSMAALAEPADGPLVARLHALAEATGIAIVAGFAEQSGGDIYNSAVFVSAGQPPVIYRKSHLYGPYEKRIFRPEKPETRMFEHAGMRFGMLVCYDVEFPENVRRLAQAGCQAVIVPTALPRGENATFIASHMIRVRAFENQVFVAYVDHCGFDGRFDYAGLSCIAAPDGSLLASAGPADEALIFAELRPADFAQSAAANTYLADL